MAEGTEGWFRVPSVHVTDVVSELTLSYLLLCLKECLNVCVVGLCGAIVQAKSFIELRSISAFSKLP